MIGIVASFSFSPCRIYAISACFVFLPVFDVASTVTPFLFDILFFFEDIDNTHRSHRLEISYSHPVTLEMAFITVGARLTDRDGRFLIFKADLRAPDGQRLARARAKHFILDQDELGILETSWPGGDSPLGEWMRSLGWAWIRCCGAGSPLPGELVAPSRHGNGCLLDGFLFSFLGSECAQAARPGLDRRAH